MNPACVNGGGSGTLVQPDRDIALEEPFTLDGPCRAALAAWEPRPGEAVTVRDRQQRDFRARVLELTEGTARLHPFEELPRPAESPLQLEVYQALPQRERFELILQKLTELGAARIIPYVSRHSIDQDEHDAKQKKSHRWPQVVLKAAKQCRRAMIPELFATLAWDAALYQAHHAELRLFLYEGRSPWSLREALEGERPRRVALFVGPEGGFAAEEFEEFRSLGFLPVSLGPRILRTETAAIAGAAVLQYALGDLY